ncbi:MAG: hypothetical protein AUJ18_08690 [Candidatus Hydrogenedentes bacterium CG1_02_42_14]|nr:MAG: hypothetical protein AUJ18_08690 [Candidatus Hydrogenedentes bacterium CG1_02_42_14]
MCNVANILLTGGTGLLGTHLLKLDSSLIAPGRNELDLLKQESVEESFRKIKPDIVIHAGAITETHYVNAHPSESILTNIAGTTFISSACIEYSSRLIYISTDYLYPGTHGLHKEDEPLYAANFYTWTKLGGECAVRLVPNSLIIRTSFGPRPCQYAYGATDKISSKIYVDEIAPLILELAKSNETGIINVGGEPTSIYEYAKRTNPEVKPTTLAEINEPIPADTSLDLTRLKNLNLQKINHE